MWIVGHFAEPIRVTTEYAFNGKWDKVMSWTVLNLLVDDLVSWREVAPLYPIQERA